MRFISLILIALILFSCQEENEPTKSAAELFEITINANLDALNISSSGRISSDSTDESSVITDLYYSIRDSLCNEIDTYGRMINGEELPSIILPNLAAGKYYYSITAQGENGIRYDTASSFTLESDTIVDATLKNKQMRYRFIAITSIDTTEVQYVDYQINYTSVYWYYYPECGESGQWSSDEYNGHYNATSFSSHYQYENPIDLESIHLRFYDQNENVVKSRIIPIIKKLDHHHSYTFEVDLSAIWTDESQENSIQLYLEEIDWTEEVIDLNG